jgi:hypothetical protein
VRVVRFNYVLSWVGCLRLPRFTRSVLLAATVLVLSSCSVTMDTASSPEDASTTDTTPTVSSSAATTTPASESGSSTAGISREASRESYSDTPDPAFDPLLSTLEQMTTAPIMLPASLPPELKSVAIGDATSGDRYTILFLAPGGDPTRIVQPYVHATVIGTLTASPIGADAKVGFGAPLGSVALPDGTVADLRRIVPSEGANSGPRTVGTFEEGSERYRLEIESIDSPEGDLARQVLSTMVRVDRAQGGTEQRVSFPSGGTSAVREGAVVRGERVRYLLDARAGQRMIVHISSLEDNAVFQVYEPGLEQTLDGAGEGDDATDWSGELPVDGDYTIVVGGTRGNASYRLEVMIE